MVRSAGIRRGRRGRSRLGVVCALVTLFGTHAAAAVDDDAVVQPTAAGRWTLALDDTNRQCRLILRNQPIEKLFAVGMPAGCRRALPILSAVSRWDQAATGVRFDDDQGKPVLQFTSQRDAATLVAKGPEGEIYSLKANDGGHIDGLPSETVVAQAEPPPAPAAGATQPAAGPDPATLPGRYAILRRGGKDTGCMLTLDAKAKGPKRSRKAILAPSCKDQGIVIFNPAGWRFEDGRLVLIAKKGHSTRLDLQKDGTWSKDPGEGAPMSLKKT